MWKKSRESKSDVTRGKRKLCYIFGLNTPRWVQETVRHYSQESIEAFKEQQKPKPEGSFPRPSLGYPVAYPFAPEASFLLSLPAGFMRRGQGILGDVLHASPRSRTFYGLPLSKGIFCEMGTCTSSGSSCTMEA